MLLFLCGSELLVSKFKRLFLCIFAFSESWDEKLFDKFKLISEREFKVCAKEKNDDTFSIEQTRLARFLNTFNIGLERCIFNHTQFEEVFI